MSKSIIFGLTVEVWNDKDIQDVQNAKDLHSLCDTEYTFAAISVISKFVFGLQNMNFEASGTKQKL